MARRPGQVATPGHTPGLQARPCALSQQAELLLPALPMQDDEALPADMAVQLAALTRPLAEQGCAPASDCPVAEQDAAAAGEPAASTGGGPSCSVADPGGSSTEDAPAPSRQPGSDGSGVAEDAPPTPTPALPPYLRLGPAAADFQPPSELRERLRLLISCRGPGSAGVLRSNDAATFASSGTEARAALLYVSPPSPTPAAPCQAAMLARMQPARPPALALPDRLRRRCTLSRDTASTLPAQPPLQLHITTQAVDFATQVLTEVHESTLAPDCLALKDWLALVGGLPPLVGRLSWASALPRLASLRPAVVSAHPGWGAVS